MTVDFKADVAVIGAGPAGSTAAALLAKRGLRVTLIDRDKFPRDKLCGEFLSYDALPILDLLGVTSSIDEAGAARIRTCRIIGSRRTVAFDLPVAARGISRLRLDEILLESARTHCARILTGHAAEKVSGGGGARMIELTHEGARVTVETSFVIGAWGRWGRLDRQMERSFVTETRERHFGFKKHYRRRSPGPDDTIDLYSFDSGYLGVSKVEDDLTNICGLVHGSRLKGNRGGWEGFVDRLAAENRSLGDLYRDHESVQQLFLSSEPVIFRSRSSAEQGMLLVGDAAGMIDPLTGNGMAMAIQSALLASTAVLRALGGHRADAAADYRSRHSRLFGSRLRWSRSIASLLSRPHLLDRLLTTMPVRAIGPFLLRKTRSDRGELDRAIRLWNDPVHN